MARPIHTERCGNFTGGPGSRDVDHLQGPIAGASLITAEAKRLCAARRAASPVCLEQMPRILEAWSNYIEECEKTKRPLTWGGFALAADISTRTIDRMRQGDLDHMVDEYRITHDLPADATEYITEEGEVIQLVEWSQVCQKLEALIQDQLERNCYTNKGNPAGSIFGLKARFDWQDQADARTTISSNTLVIADADQAKKAMQMLTGIEK